MRKALTVSRAMILAADRRLDRHLKQLPRDQVLQSLAQGAAAPLGLLAVDDDRERVDRLAVDEDVHQHEVALAVVVDLVVEAGIAAADRFQPVVEIEDDLVQRQAIDQHRPVAGIGQIDLLAAALFAQRQDRPEIGVGDEDRRLDPRLLDMVDPHRIGHVGRVVQGAHRAVGQMHPVDDRGGGREQVEVEFARQPLLDDLEMEETEKPAAEPEAERHRGLGLVFEARIVEPKLGEAVAQPLVIGRIGREQAAEDDRLHRLEAGQRRPRRAGGPR